MSLLNEGQIDAFAGVGFALNPVAEIDGYYNDQPDNTLSDYHAQINWGDSPAWDTNTKLTLDSSNGYVEVEGTHTYASAGEYDVTVYVTGPDGQTASATTSEVVVIKNPVTATLSAPAVTDSNAAQEVPYRFSLLFQSNGGMISGTSVSGATVQVVPPGGEAITATLVSTALSGNTDGHGDASVITATYDITPPNGAWDEAPQGTYTVTLGGAPVTGVGGGQAPQGSLGTFPVNVAVGLVLEVPPADATVTEGASIPVEVEAVGASGKLDAEANETGTIQLNGTVFATFALQSGVGFDTLTAPKNPGQFVLVGYSGNLKSAGTDIIVQAPQTTPGPPPPAQPPPNNGALTPPDLTTDQGALEALLLVENKNPMSRHYSATVALRSMQAMNAAVHNRLRYPAAFGAPGATTLSQLLVSSQFKGFSPQTGGGVTITPELQSLIDTIYSYASTNNKFQTQFRQYIQDADDVVTSPVSDPFAAQGGTYFWRTAGKGSPGGGAVTLKNGVIGGNQFYSYSPPSPKKGSGRKSRKGHRKSHK